MLAQLCDDEIETPLVEFVASRLAPLCREITPLSAEGPGDIEHMLFGVKNVHDLDGVRHMLVG